MRQFFLFMILFYAVTISTNAYERKSIVERYTNYQCGPCATINNSWYNSTVSGLLAEKKMIHIVYNVNWPGANDPMYHLNAVDNAARWAYYGVNSVPWININGTRITNSQANLVNAVNNGNAEFSPFKIDIIPERFSNNVFNINVKVHRDENDNTTFAKTMLRVAILEKTVPSPSGGIEPFYYEITRRLIPNAKGTEITIPDAGDFIEYNFMYIPNQQFLNAVNLDSLLVVAFIQNEATKYIYQASEEDVIFSENINAAFLSNETMGALPLEIQFTDYSTGTGTNNINSWKWDFDNDGVIDSEEKNPFWTFNSVGTYSVKLEVGDGTNTNSRIINNLITVLGATSDILVVNGIDYVTYPAEMLSFYNNSAPFGEHDVDIWDLFGDQGFNYSANPKIHQVNLYNRTIPFSIMKLYKKIIWLGNNFSGDLNFWKPDEVLEYVQGNGNFLLATRMANLFLTGNLRNYTGIAAISGDQTPASIIAMDENLVNMNSISSNSFTHFVSLSSTSEAEPIFDNADPSDIWVAGFKLNKRGEGVFIFIAGRPYRYDNFASAQNYNYIIENWMTASEPTSVNDENLIINNFSLSQNYPNPFNPSTTIEFVIASDKGAKQSVQLKVYDVLGNEVATLVNENKSAGKYSVNFNGSKLSSGIYYYKLVAGDFVSVKKMMLMK